jgi:hypothetical protein
MNEEKENSSGSFALLSSEEDNKISDFKLKDIP